MLRGAVSAFRIRAVQDHLDACGTASAAFDIGGCSEIIERGVTGEVAPAGDATALGNSRAIAAISKSIISSGVPLVASHAYTIVSTSVVSGTQYITLRNPWGNDGAGSDADTSDGLVTMTFAQFQSNFSSGSIQV